ncbi:MAG TPA: hypothetical protein VNX28_03015, partial [Gemmataceae bacterium]|nr:hypothetical protein [Gemmataceae bacterium]
MLEFFEQLSGPEESTREIAARRKAEELSRRANIELTVQINDLRAEEERFRLLTESAVGYALIFLDVRGNVESWNAGAERLKGYR